MQCLTGGDGLMDTALSETRATNRPDGNRAAGIALCNNNNSNTHTKKGHLVNDTQDATSDLTGIQETKLFQFSDVVSQAEDCEFICVGEEAERGAGG